MIHAKEISAVIVTKEGPVPAEVLAPLDIFREIVIWDNSIRKDAKVFGRFVAADECGGRFIYVQDDDCVVDAAALVGEYESGTLLCNMPQDYRRGYDGTGIALVGFGAIFPRKMNNFRTYLEKHPCDEVFLRECDRVFTYLHWDDVRLADVGVKHLDKAYGADRMWKEERHEADLVEIRQRLAAL